MNGSGRSPALLDLPRALADVGSHEHGLESLPAAHIHTVTVPGAAAGWEDAVAAWGRLPLARVLAPSIELAERGFPVSPITAHSWHAGIAQLETGPHGHEMLVRVSGSPLDGTDAANAASTSRRFPSHRAPRAGEVFRNPNLARTLRLVAEHGASKGFYTGETGAAIVELVQSLGGVLSADDLAAHRSDFVDPISAVYRGIEVHEIPPNGQGITALLALNILQV